MAQISNITLPNGNNYDLKGSMYTVIGTQTANTASWTGVLDTIDALYDGLTIAYYLSRTSANNVTLNLTLKDNVATGAIPVYYKTNTRLGTHYAAGDMVIMTYWSAGSIKINGTATTDNRWIAHADYNTNTTYSNASLGTCMCTCETAAETAAKVAAMVSGTYSLAVNGVVSVRFTNANTAASATLNIGSKGAKPIWYQGAALTATTAKIWSAGDTVVFHYDGTRYNIISIDQEHAVEIATSNPEFTQQKIWIEI